MTLKRYTAADFPLTSLAGGGADWTNTAGAEYRYDGALVVFEPLRIVLNGSTAAKGTVGALAAGEWGWDDATQTLHVRLSDDTDPDTKPAGYVQGSTLHLLLTVPAGKTLIGLSLLINNNEETENVNTIVLVRDALDVALAAIPTTVKNSDGVLALQEKLILQAEDKMLMMSSHPNVSVWLSCDESDA